MGRIDNMEKLFEVLRVFWVGLCALFGYLYGSFDGLLAGLITFVILDYILGVAAAITEGKLSSKIGFKGILRKVVIFVIVATAKILGYNILGIGMILRDAVIGFYIFNEGISLLENAKRLGVKVPDDIMTSLKKVKDKFKLKSDTDKSDNDTKSDDDDTDNVG